MTELSRDELKALLRASITQTELVKDLVRRCGEANMTLKGAGPELEVLRGARDKLIKEIDAS